MIERQIIAGQPCTVVYFQPDMIPGDRNNHSLVKLIFDNGIIQFLAPQPKTTDAFDPNEKRDESGRWTAGGGASRKSEEPTTSFVSPNVEVQTLSFSQAEEGLKSPRQKLLAGISQQIDKTLGIKDIRVNHVVGAWADGAENSVMTNSARADIQVERAAAAAKAFLANQKAVLLFHPDENGSDFLAQFRVKGKLSEIHESLLKAGVEFHTLEPRGADVVVHVYGDNPQTLEVAAKAAKSYNANLTVHPGNGEFIGTTKTDGTDEEQRADARAIYQKTIEGVAATGQLPDQWRSQWQNYIDNWERETGQRIGGGELLTAEEHGGTRERVGGGVQRGGSGSLEEAQRTSEKAASGYPKIEGLPDKPIKMQDGSYYVPGPLGKAHEVADKYMKAAGIPYSPPQTYKSVDKDRAVRVAQAFDEMKHDPNDPKVKAAYAALAKETIAQWHAVKESGLKVEWIKPDQADPYAETPRLAAKDVAENNHWWGFPTDQGFGTGEEAEHARQDNPLLEMTDEVIDGRKCCVNDLFRIVHDYFGHFKEGVGFRASGEENAWRSHASMYSKEALPAVTSETRGQNSWVNFGPHGETNRKATAADTYYAPQKIGIMPEWTWQEGREDDKR